MSEILVCNSFPTRSPIKASPILRPGQGAEHDRPPKGTFSSCQPPVLTPASLSARLVLFSDTRLRGSDKRGDPVAIAGRTSCPDSTQGCRRLDGLATVASAFVPSAQTEAWFLHNTLGSTGSRGLAPRGGRSLNRLIGAALDRAAPLSPTQMSSRRFHAGSIGSRAVDLRPGCRGSGLLVVFGLLTVCRLEVQAEEDRRRSRAAANLRARRSSLAWDHQASHRPGPLPGDGASRRGGAESTATGERAGSDGGRPPILVGYRYPGRSRHRERAHVPVATRQTRIAILHQNWVVRTTVHFQRVLRSRWILHRRDDSRRRQERTRR